MSPHCRRDRFRYVNYPTGSSGREVYVFEQSVPPAAGKTAEAVTLPSLGSVVGYNAALPIFAMAIGWPNRA